MSAFFAQHRIEIVSLAACFVLIGFIFELVRRNAIKEKYSFVWFLTGTILIALTLKRDWLAQLSSAIGVYYPPTALFLVLNFFMIVILVHFSMIISKLLTQNQKLAQKLALMEADMMDKTRTEP